ncbi:MAG: dihydropteroate synthase, partial [Gammaproteobacteria bacterium]
VSPHARSAVREADKARRMMYAAREDDSLPKGVDSSLLTTHERKPFPYDLDEITELANDIRDPSYRVQISEEGIHVYNRDGMISGQDPFELFSKLESLQDDAPHAFYMGVELAKAQIAWQLGKRYNQDEELDWGAAIQTINKADHATAYKEAGATLKASRDKK